MSTPVLLAVDGGNFKTDVVLVDAGGELLALVRGPRSSPHHLGVTGCVELLDQLIRQAARDAELKPGARPVGGAGTVLLAGADLPEELVELREAIEARGWVEQVHVDNDTFAVLRAGTDRGWGVAVVCGGGINCVGVGPDGRHVRFPALGQISGDWGGGYDLGLAALGAAARAADGRGPRTSLEQSVPAHFGFATPLDVARAVHLRRLPGERLGELARVVYAAAPGDLVAASLVDRLASEVVAFAGVALRRLGLLGEPADVVLGGSLLLRAPATLLDAVALGVEAVAPRARVVVAASQPIVGAALLALDAAGAEDDAKLRLRRVLDAAVSGLEARGPNGGSPRTPDLARRTDG